MHLIIPLTIFVNITAIAGLLIGLFGNLTKPKHKAILGYSIAGSMLAYIILLGLVTIYRWIFNPDFYSFILTLCVISPFAIGKLVKFETLKKYTIIQIMFYIASLVILFL